MTPGTAPRSRLETGVGNETRTRDPDLGKAKATPQATERHGILVRGVAWRKVGARCYQGPLGDESLERLHRPVDAGK